MSMLKHLLCSTWSLLIVAAFPVGAVSSPDASPTVKAVLFYGPDCSECAELLEHFVPGLMALHGDRLEIAGIDVGRREGGELFESAAGKYGLPRRWGGEPVALVGDQALSGLPAIAITLGDRLDRLTNEEESLRWPPLAGLPAALPGALEDIRSRVAQAGPLTELPAKGSQRGRAWTDQIGNGLAIVVLIGMVLATGHAVYRVRQGRRHPVGAGWIIATLSAGIAISAYTAYTAIGDVVPMCGPVGDCAAVQQSEYARIAGIPMGVLGLLGYGLILVSWVAARRASPRGGSWRWLPWSITLVGVLFSIRLTALEPFVIGATCLWCLGSAVAITILLWLLSGETARVQNASADG
jgi:uncharacterized membrane protein